MRTKHPRHSDFNRLPKEATFEFIQIWEKEFGVCLQEENAQQLASSYLDFFYLLTKDKTSETNKPSPRV